MYARDFLSNSSFPSIPIFLPIIHNLLAHGRSAALAEIGLLGLDIVDTLGKDSGILGLGKPLVQHFCAYSNQNTHSSILGSLGVAALERDAVALVLEALWGNKALDFWCLGVCLLALTLWLDLAADDELADL
jgi:hypothetical protein